MYNRQLSYKRFMRQKRVLVPCLISTNCHEETGANGPLTILTGYTVDLFSLHGRYYLSNLPAQGSIAVDHGAARDREIPATSHIFSSNSRAIMKSMMIHQLHRQVNSHRS
ncbi:hypothetical protein ACCI49_01850 [Microbulbifer epialgicus]|uniref:Uncharacterized protein n=1 Tax=Microbulbifer epialgicus TaxID=393907 RepID=A0ABV4NU62_9GAMM